MDWKIFLTKITNVENSVDLSKIKYLDFNPWPYIRLSIFNKWSAGNSDGIQTKMGQDKKYINLFLSLFKYFFIYIKNPIKRQKVDIIYFTNISWFKETIREKVFDKNSDSFWYFFSREYNIKNIEVSNFIPEKNNQLFFNKNVTYIHFLLLVTRIKYRLLSYFKSEALVLPDDLNESVKRNFSIQVDVINQLSLINFMSLEFMKILTSYKPKVVFLAVFYCPNSMAISLACHRLGIRVVEYQHGAPNEYHAMYTHWHNVPCKGYELIPDVFWTWGESSKNIIDNWSKNNTRHKAVIGGNLWMTFFRTCELDKNLVKHYKCYNKDKINILVSLQGDQFFPYFLLEILKENTDTFIWHFRDHPSLRISDDLKNKISCFPNTEFNISSVAPLYELLELTDIHITSFSTVAFEAQTFNIATIFTHINALNGYGDLLNKNGLYYAETSEMLSSLIDKILHSNEKVKPEHILSDIELHRNTLSLLIDGSDRNQE